MDIRNRLAAYKAERRCQKLEKQYQANAHPMRFDWNWSEIHYNRIALVNLLVNLRGGADCKYLEIGCAQNALFDSVCASFKIGIDPEQGGTNLETSDSFFSYNKQKFNVIFVDGLHEYEQVRKDVINGIRCLEDGGWIAFHDVLPRNWKEHHIPRLQSAWTGDCWKLAVELSKSQDIDFKIINIDHGVGVLRLKKPHAEVLDLRYELRDKQFGYFVEALNDLPRVYWADGLKWIMSYS
jgi:hypothetical protein